MAKVAVVYWSGTGNTQQMAEKVAEAAGAELFTSADFSADKVAEFDAIALGCPSMGAEVLEEGEFQPMYDDIRGKLSGKKVALFGSYGWGDGEWMRNWDEDVRAAGAQVVCDFVICNGAPDDSALNELADMGKALAK